MKIITKTYVYISFMIYSLTLSSDVEMTRRYLLSFYLYVCKAENAHAYLDIQCVNSDWRLMTSFCKDVCSRKDEVQENNFSIVS